MFEESKAFSGFSTDNLAEAKTFYQDILGLKVKEFDEMGGMLELQLATGGKVLIYSKGEDHKPASYTVLNFPVDDVEKAVDSLLEKGVTFEKYEGFDQDEKGIARGIGPLIAWFTDPAGNILSVLEDDATK